MRKFLRILAVISALVFVCAAALAQTQAPSQPTTKLDAGSAPPPPAFLGGSKAAPMPFKAQKQQNDAPREAKTPAVQKK